MILQAKNHEHDNDGHDHCHGPDHADDPHGHHEHQGDHHGHAYTHGIVAPSILTPERGIRAVRWSSAGLVITAFIQVIIVYYSGSIALIR